MIDYTTCLGQPSIMWGRLPYKYSGENLGTGNRCGHDPLKLAVNRLDLHQPAGGNWPRLIQAGIKRIQDYFSDAAALPPLAHLSKKTNQDGTPRQNRSEAREGHALVLSVIFTYLDLKSLRVGHFTNTGAFVSISFLDIARRCGLLYCGFTGCPSSRRMCSSLASAMTT